jgi:hypothetical protein
VSHEETRKVQFETTPKRDQAAIDHMVPAVAFALLITTALCAAALPAAIKVGVGAAGVVSIVAGVQLYALVRFIATIGLLLRVRLSITLSEPSDGTSSDVKEKEEP